jgi:hypothetical protein
MKSLNAVVIAGIICFSTVRCQLTQTTVVGPSRLIGASVCVDGVQVGRLARKRVIEFVTFNSVSPFFVRTRVVGRLILTRVSPGYHTLTIKQSGAESCVRFKEGQHLVDLDGSSR